MAEDQPHVLEALSEEECYLWAILQDRSGIDQAEMLWSDPRNDDNCFRAYPYQWSWWRCEDPLQIDQCARSVGKSQGIEVRMFAFPFLFPGQEAVITAPELIHLEPITQLVETRFEKVRLGREMKRKDPTHRPFMCIAEGQMVLTERGYVPIESVAVGDKVLTHLGRWRPVTAVHDNGERDTVFLRGTGHLGIQATPDHRFYARRRVQKEDRSGTKRRMVRVLTEPDWIPPSGWRTKDPATMWASPARVDLSSTAPPPIFKLNKQGFGVGRGAEIEVYTTDFMWFLGEYMAEGSACAPNLVSLAVHEDEVAHVSGVLSRIGLHYAVANGTGRCKQIRITNAVLAQWIMTHLPGDQHERQVPTWVLGLPVDLRRSFYDGYVYGDGTETKLGHQHPWTCSKALAYSLRILTNSLGYAFGISYVPPRSTTFASSGPQYQMHVNPVWESGSHRHVVFENGMAWTAATRLEDVRTARVFDLTVDEDHSYVVEGVVVHNCEFVNGARIIGRIPQKDGKGIKGTHPIWLEQDEASDYPEPGWKEIVETLKRGSEGSMWRAHGVTRGMRDSFYKNSQHGQDDPPLRTISRVQDNKWTVHRIVAMARPNWTAAERLEKEQQYGSREDPDYRRNVLGAHGDAQNPLFVMHRLMRCWLGDTPIMTLDSLDRKFWKPIQEVCVGDRVQTAIGSGVVTAQPITLASKVVRFTTDGQELVCSPEHPVLTLDGWKYADDLVSGDLLVGDEAMQGVWRQLLGGGEVSDGHALQAARLLLASVLGEVRWEELSRLGYPEADVEGMRSMWRDVLSAIESDPVLLARLCEQAHRLDPTSAHRTSMSAMRDTVHALSRESSVLFDGLFVHCEEEGQAAEDEDAAYASGGSRRTARRAVRPLASLGRRVAAAVLDVTTRRSGRRRDLLPTGPGIAPAEVGGRGGRPGALAGAESIHGFDSRCLASLRRVDRVEVLQSGDPEFAQVSGGANHVTLYDLTVAGHPSYVVGPDLLSHNCVDDDPSTDYNTDDYYHFAIKDTELDRMQADIVDLLLLPEHHRKYKTIWMGADIGWTTDPTEILIFAEYPLTASDEEAKQAKARGKALPEKGMSRMKCIGRVTLRRISEPAQVDVIISLIDFYKPRCFAMDSTGAGLPLFQQLQRRMNDYADTMQSKKAREAAESVKGFNFSSKIVVDFDETIEEEKNWDIDERVKEAGITRNVLEYSTDLVRTYVDDGRLWLPWDTELIGEMGGQTFSYSKASMDRYGRRRIFSQGTFHALDAMRMAVLGHKQFAIDALLAEKEKPPAPVIDSFVMQW